MYVRSYDRVVVVVVIVLLVVVVVIEPRDIVGKFKHFFLSSSYTSAALKVRALALLTIHTKKFFPPSATEKVETDAFLLLAAAAAAALNCHLLAWMSAWALLLPLLPPPPSAGPN